MVPFSVPWPYILPEDFEGSSLFINWLTVVRETRKTVFLIVLNSTQSLNSFTYEVNF